MPRPSLPAAIAEVTSRDPVLARLAARLGPIGHRPRDSDGPFGALVRAIVAGTQPGRSTSGSARSAAKP